MVKHKHARQAIVGVGIILGSLLISGQAQADPANIDNDADHRCIVKADHSVWCWGNPTPLQTTPDTVPRPTTPTKIEGVQATQVASTRQRTCALGTDQTVQCWDNNQKPPEKLTDAKVSVVRKDPYTTCVVDTDHNVRCWGLLMPDDPDARDGQVMNPDVKMKDVTTGLNGGICAIALDDSVWCWDTPYQDKPDADRPVKIPNISAKKIEEGGGTTCAIDKNDEAWCWGKNNNGQLGANVPGESKTPVRVEKLDKKLVDISGTTYSFCAVDTEGAVWCWGGYRPKSLIPNPDPNYPEVPLSNTDHKAVSISLSDNDACIEDTAGDLWCSPFRSHGDNPENKTSLQKVDGINLK